MLSFIDIYELVKARILLIVLFVIVGILSAILFLYISEPEYRAEVLMVPVHGEQESAAQSMISQFGSLAGMGSFRNSESPMTTESYLSLISSRSFLSKFAEENEILPILFSDLWDEESNKWKIKPPTKLQSHKLLSQKVISYSFDKKANLVKFYVTWTDPSLAAEWANKLIESINNYARDADIKEADLSKSFLLKQLEATSLINPQNMLNDLIEKQIKTIMLANVKEGYVFRVLDKAYVPESQSFPRPLLTLAISMVLSSFLALLYIFSIETRRQINLKH